MTKTPSRSIAKALKKIRRKVLKLQADADAVNLDNITGTELRRLDLAKPTLAVLIQSLLPSRESGCLNRFLGLRADAGTASSSEFRTARPPILVSPRHLRPVAGLLVLRAERNSRPRAKFSICCSSALMCST